MSSSYIRHERFLKNSNRIKNFCERYDLQYELLNSGYQIRIENTLDVYPVNQKWHEIKTNKRGEWSDVSELGKFFLLQQKPIMISDHPFGVSRVHLASPSTQKMVDDILHFDKSKANRKWWHFWRKR